MAERRMFAKTIVDSDAFLDMPLSAQCLYFHLNMRADDDGFVNNPNKISRMIGASADDLKLLIAKSFIITFENGVIVIKHWRLNNWIRGDRHHDTVYQDEMALLSTKENGTYTLCQTDGCQLVDTLATEVRLGKVSIDKDRLGKSKDGDTTPTYYPNDEKLNSAFKDFVDMRKAIKKPMTARAIELAIKKLDSLANGDNDKAVEIVNQSILNGWQSFYDLKPDFSKTKANKGIDWENV